jgi:hypothetical protein
MKTKRQTKPGIHHLREWFRTLVNFQFDPRWITNPVAHRASRPKILGAETEREKRTNDLLCARFTANAGRAKK